MASSMHCYGIITVVEYYCRDSKEVGGMLRYITVFTIAPVTLYYFTHETLSGHLLGAA